jgi:hypothetical protein
MLGSVKPYYRQVRPSLLPNRIPFFCSQAMISTGKSDWEKEVTEVEGTLASFLLQVHKKALSSAPDPITKAEHDHKIATIPGVFHSSESSRLAILNGSHTTVSEDCTKETVLVLPDYKAVVGVPRTLEGAEELWRCALDPSLGRAGEADPSFRSWLLPYSCLILLCAWEEILRLA